ncbi:hypothetical protein C5S32_04935 [ANME-1 cluster archaeon GoMg1]|nr:hypothetical protein [ANME-1 cluster archaeon GoMg1]
MPVEIVGAAVAAEAAGAGTEVETGEVEGAEVEVEQGTG